MKHTCEGCDRITEEELVHIPGWDYQGCPQCVAECAILVSREDAQGEPLCPIEYDLLLESKTVAGMLQALKAHQGTPCVYCGHARQSVGIAACDLEEKVA